MVIVIGYSPSPAGHAALERGIEEVRLRGGRLVVVNSSRGDALVDRRYAQGDQVTDVEAELTASGLDWQLEQPVRGRDAGDEIVEAALAHRAELVVIGLRHRTPVGKLITGSTTQRVLLEAPCPVLTVKAPH
jgi:nucleotide-binding universal stress UspA family protein